MDTSSFLMRPRLCPLLTSLLSLIALAASGLHPLWAQGQSASYFTIAKGRILSQTSAAAPTPLSTGGAVFQAQAPGFGGPPLVTAGSLTLPGGATQALSYDDPSATYQFVATADSAAALTAAYPVGRYTIKLTSTVLQGMTANIDLPVDNFPAAPQINNFSAAQALDATQDFDLTFQPFTGAGQLDEATIAVYDGTDLLFSDSLGSSDTSYTIPAGTLESAKTYEGRIRFKRISANLSSFPVPATAFFSETRFSIKTTGGAIDTTPPTLLQAIPANGTILPHALAGLVLQFSEPMDPNKIAVQWTATLNDSPVTLSTANFSYHWSDSSTLACFYALSVDGGWPPGLKVDWKLNATAGNASNFADAGGNLLAVNTYSGSFLTPGGPWNCAAQLTQPLEAPAFFLTKSARYLQTSDDLPVPDPKGAGQFSAFYKDPNSIQQIAPIVMLKVPILNNPTNHLVKALIVDPNSPPGVALRTFSDILPSVSALESTYPLGDYTLQLAIVNPVIANPPLPPLVTNSVVLGLPQPPYPPVPQFANLAAAQSFATTSDFTLSWAPYQVDDASSAYISVRITDADGKTVFTAPNACAGIALTPAGTSVKIPANTLEKGKTYNLALAFGRILTPLQTMPSIPGQGFSSLESVTRLSLVVNDNGFAQPPPAIAITSPASGAVVSNGNVAFHVTASDAGAPITKVEIHNGDQVIATSAISPAQNNFSGTLSATLSPGRQTVTAVLTDSNGISATSQPLSFMVRDPNFLVQITAPQNGAGFAPASTVNVAVSAASPHGVVTAVELFVDDRFYASTRNVPFTFALSELSPGTHSLRAQARDNADFSGGSTEISVTLQSPPAGEIAPDVTPEGKFVAAFSGLSAGDYVLEGTSDLTPPVSWLPVQTRRLSDHSGIFADNSEEKPGSRFYRVVPLDVSITNARPHSVDVYVDEATSASAAIQGAGAALKLRSSDGTLFSLTLPAVGYFQPVAMDLVTNLSGSPLSGKLLAAVEISPADLDLPAGGLLKVELQSSLQPSQIIAFGFRAPASELYLLPFEATSVGSSLTVQIPITELGGYGIAVLDSSDISLLARFEPSNPRDQTRQLEALAHYLQQPRQGALSARLLLPPISRDGLISRYLNLYNDIYYQLKKQELLVESFRGPGLPAGWIDAMDAFADFAASVKKAGVAVELSAVLLSGGELAGKMADKLMNLNLDLAQQHRLGALATLEILSLNYLDTPAWTVALPSGTEILRSKIHNVLSFSFTHTSSYQSTATPLRTDYSGHASFHLGDRDQVYKPKGQGSALFPVMAMVADAPGNESCGPWENHPAVPNLIVYDLLFIGQGFDLKRGKVTVDNINVVAYPGEAAEHWSTTCADGKHPYDMFWFQAFVKWHKSENSEDDFYPDILTASLFELKPAHAFNIAHGESWQLSDGNAALAKLIENSQDDESQIKGKDEFRLTHTPE